MPIDDKTAARLLSGKDEPSVIEQEAIFEEVMRKVAPPRAVSPWRWLWAPSLAAAAALFFVMVRPSERPAEHSQFVARGAAERGLFAVQCLDLQGTEQNCQAGMRVGLELEPPQGQPFFALFVRRPDGAIIWYFPKDGEDMPSVASARAGKLWSEGAELAPNAAAGSYSWFAVFAPRTLSRDELKAALGDELRGDGSITVIERKVSIVGRP